jgi:hypothetical protein
MITPALITFPNPRVINERLIKVEWKRILKRLGRTREFAWRILRRNDRQSGLAGGVDARLLVQEVMRLMRSIGEKMTWGIVGVWV